MKYHDHEEVSNEALAEALQAVNEVRAVLGRVPLFELPKGTPEEADHCPVAIATGMTTDIYYGGGTDTYQGVFLLSDDEDAQLLADAGYVVMMGDPIKLQAWVVVVDGIGRFLSLFDEHEYPELIGLGW